MVKGVSRQVIMVDSPDPSMFEKAIFIIRDGKGGAGYAELMKEAQSIAENYLRGNVERRKKRTAPVIYTAAGAALTGAIWLLARIVF
ncbi:MAG: hypothetical protein ILP09_02075 [Oscillospiraceae bacterium]|nr:hypothetical protein [Oscillospiraceae bacterium]